MRLAVMAVVAGMGVVGMIVVAMVVVAAIVVAMAGVMVSACGAVQWW